MEGDLISVWGETDGTNTTGEFTLNSDLFTNTPTYLAIPKGCKLKLWAFELSGAACTVTMQVSKDNGATWTTVKTFDLVSPGELSIEKKSRPIVTVAEVPYVAGTSGVLVKFSWSQSTAAKSYMHALVEIVKEE